MGDLSRRWYCPICEEHVYWEKFYQCDKCKRIICINCLNNNGVCKECENTKKEGEFTHG